VGLSFSREDSDDGDKDGNPVGMAEGNPTIAVPDGFVLDAVELGAGLGLLVGLDVGRLEGSFEGSQLGFDVGSCVGKSVGALVG
jgi:hypothetical protein